jgi:hypothetical protein
MSIRLFPERIKERKKGPSQIPATSFHHLVAWIRGKVEKKRKTAIPHSHSLTLSLLQPY